MESLTPEVQYFQFEKVNLSKGVGCVVEGVPPSLSLVPVRFFDFESFKSQRRISKNSWIEEDQVNHQSLQRDQKLIRLRFSQVETADF